jgi:hypothetical protein
VGERRRGFVFLSVQVVANYSYYMYSAESGAL